MPLHIICKGFFYYLNSEKQNIMQNSNLNTILDNAFIVKRQGTKHRNEFTSNEFIRPVTMLDFFQLLANSKINLTSYTIIKYACHINATNYTTKFKSDMYLIVKNRFASIEIKGFEHLNISLNWENFTYMFQWFKDESLFTTDFGDIKKSKKYYQPL